VPLLERLGIARRCEDEAAVAGGVAGRVFGGEVGDLRRILCSQGGAAQSIVGRSDVPLVGQPRLDRHVGAVAVADGMGMVLDVLEEVVVSEPVDDGDAGVFTAEAEERLRVGAGVVPAVLVGDGGVGGHDVDDGQVVAEADLPVVGVVRRGDLQEAGGHSGLGVAFGVGHDDVVVFDDGDDATDDRKRDGLAAHGVGLRIVRVHGDCRVAEHRLGSGGGDRDVAGAVGERVPEVPHVPVDVFHFDFVIGQRSAGDRVPVDQPLAPVDQAVLEELVEGVADRGGAHLVHREAGAVVVAARSHRLELREDDGLVLVLPLLRLLDERFAADLEPADAVVQQSLLDDGLGGDAGVVGARHPQRAVALHPVVPDQHVLQGVVERMAEVQGRRHVRRRDDDAVGVAGSGLGMEGIGLVPAFGDRLFGVDRDVGLREVGECVRHCIERYRRTRGPQGFDGSHDDGFLADAAFGGEDSALFEFDHGAEAAEDAQLVFGEGAEQCFGDAGLDERRLVAVEEREHDESLS